MSLPLGVMCLSLNQPLLPRDALIVQAPELDRDSFSKIWGKGESAKEKLGAFIPEKGV